MTTPDIDLDKYLRIINLRTHLALELLRKIGSEEQIARYARGAMPVDELLTMARAELFSPFHGIDAKRFSKSSEIVRMRHQIIHQDRCPERGREDAELKFSSIDGATDLLPAQHRTLNLIRDRALELASHEWLQPRVWLDTTGLTQPIRVDTAAHIVTCAACQRRTWCASVKVSIVWAEHTLVREWLL